MQHISQLIPGLLLRVVGVLGLRFRGLGFKVEILQKGKRRVDGWFRRIGRLWGIGEYHPHISPLAPSK